MTETREGPFWDMLTGKVPPPPDAKLLGWKPVEVGQGHSRAEFQAKDEFRNPAGVVQGGFLAAMLDISTGSAAGSLLGPDEFITTLEMKVSYLRSVGAGRLVGEGRVVHKGRSVVFMEGSLTTEDGSLVATATTTGRIVPFSVSGGDRTAEG